jgi:hypothetical protein
VSHILLLLYGPYLYYPPIYTSVPQVMSSLPMFLQNFVRFSDFSHESLVIRNEQITLAVETVKLLFSPSYILPLTNIPLRTSVDLLAEL